MQSVIVEPDIVLDDPRTAPVGAGQRVVLLSHRGPVRYETDGGRLVSHRGGGGLVTALRALIRHVESEVAWVCAADSDADRLLARSREIVTAALDGPAGSARQECAVRFVELEERIHDDFYAVVANPYLWFVQHNLWGQALAPSFGRREQQAWCEGYVAANRAFAAETLEVWSRGRRDAAVMVHDYHFYLVPALLREAAPGIFVHYFVHIPWPQSDAWRVLPEEWRTAILDGILGSDVVAFHTSQYAKNFLLTCEEIGHHRVDHARSVVHVGEREVLVRHYPISVDEQELAAAAASTEVAHARDEISANRRDLMLLRVDRTDPSKNIVRGFEAYARMLELHPEIHERVTFVAHLQPSRQDVAEYADYLQRVEQTVRAVNQRFGTRGWQPIELRLRHDLPFALAAYEQFDALLVNSVVDGMNLVAKEAVLRNTRAGALLLSENTGVHEELGAVALTVHPFDIEQQAEAIWEALTMDGRRRHELHEAALEIVRTNDVRKWLSRQLADMREATADR